MEDPGLRPLTSKTRVALAIARATAAARGDRDLTPAHIAIGMFRQGTNAGLAALWYAGMTEKEIWRFANDLEKSLGEPPGNMPPHLVAIDVSPGEEEALRLGELEAAHFGAPYVSAEHILLAILRAGGPVASAFAERGISVQKYYDGIVSMKRGDPPPTEPRADSRG